MNLKALSLLLLLNLVFTASTFAKESKNKTTRRYLFGFGPTAYSNLNSRGMGTLFTGGYVWNLDAQFDLIAAVDAGISFKHNDVLLLAPQMKGHYMLNPDPEATNSWYAGGGLGVGHSRNHQSVGFPRDPVTSFMFSASLGIKFYKNTAFPLFVEIEHLMFIEESRYGTPISTSLKIGLAFPEGKTKNYR